MSNTTILIFSRDRAMQLDATLRSFFLHCTDSMTTDIVVLFRATESLHQEQYGQLQEEYTGRVQFVTESDFRIQVLDTLISGTEMKSQQYLYRIAKRLGRYFGSFFTQFAAKVESHRYVLFLVDDNIFIRNFSIADIEQFLMKCPTVIGFSLRLGENTTYCYSLDMDQPLPIFQTIDRDVYTFRWTEATADFGYPLELSSSIYRINELLPLLLGLPFRNPNTLESEMAARAHSFAKSYPKLLCFRKSVTFCVPVNRVQDVMKNRVGQDMQFSNEGLAELFAIGSRIDVQALAGFTPNACHQEVELTFEHRDR
jgi:hypothetical protein